MREMKDSGIAWIGEIPKDWALERLQWHMTEIKENNNPIKTKQVLSLTNKLGVVPYEEKGAQGNVSKENYNEYKLAYPNTIVANSMNILIGSVGICNYFGCVSPVYYVLKPNEEENLEFLNYIFQSEQFQKQLRQYANGILEIRLRVSSSGILKRLIAFPSKNKQREIVNILNKKCGEIDTLIANQEAQIEKLKQYKQSLITEVVTKGLNPNAEMKDSNIENIGKIPKHWDIASLKYLMYIRARLGWKGLKAEEYVDSGYTFIGTPNLDDNGNIDWDNVYYITKERYDESPEIKLSQGDVLLTKDGAGIGKCAYINELPCEATTNGSLAVITCKGKLEGKYLYYYFKSHYFQKLIDQIKNGMGVPHLFQGDMKNIVMPLPVIMEQKEAIEFLDIKTQNINKLIDIKQSKIAKLNEYKKSLIYEYVTGKKEA